MKKNSLKSDWLSKENQETFLTFKQYRRRYVSLNSDSLVISHDLTSDGEHKKVIPLNFSLEVSPQGECIDSKFSVNVVGVRKYTFKANSVEEANQWKNEVLNAKIRFDKERNQLLLNVKPSAEKNELKDKLRAEDMAQFALVAAKQASYNNDATISALCEAMTASSTETQRCTAQLFFKSLKTYPAKQRNNLAKAMGKALVLWLVTDAEDAQSARSHDKVLGVWIQVALSRELLSSTKFEGHLTSAPGDTGSVAGSITGSVASSVSTNTGLPRGARRGSRRNSTIMPFRADSCECLFLSSFIHAVSLRSHLLYRVLYPVLRPLATNSEAYIIAMPTKSAKLSPAAGTAPATSNGFVGAFMSMFRQLGSTPSPDSSVPSQPAVQKNDQGDSKSPSVVRANIYELIGNLLTQLQSEQCDGALPGEMDVLVRTIKEVTVASVDSQVEEAAEHRLVEHVHANGNASGRAASPVADPAGEEELADLRDQITRFEFGRFYTSCTALLFLRLICPSIISPDWLPSISDAQEVVSTSSSACCAMILISHCLSQQPQYTTPSPHSHTTQMDGILSKAAAIEGAVPVDEAIKILEANYAPSRSSRPLRVSRESSHHGGSGDSDSLPDYELDLTHMPTRKALAEIAKALLHLSNMACLPREEMEGFAQDSLIRQSVSSGLLDKDAIDSHVMSAAEIEVMATQLRLAGMIKGFYESVGDLGGAHW